MPAAHKVDDALHLVVGDEAALYARRLARALRRIEHIAAAKQLFRAARVKNGAAVDLAGYRKRDAAGDVRLDDAGDHVDRRALGRDDQMDTRRARQLRQAADGLFHLARGDHHQVCQLVDDDDDLAHLLFVLADGVVVALDVAHAHRLKALVAVLHLNDRPAERRGGLFRVGDDRHQQVRNAVVNGKLDDLRVDENELDLVGVCAVDDGVDDRVDAHGLTGTRRARDEHMRHLRHVGDDRRAGNALAQRHRGRGLLALHLRALQHVAQGDRLDLVVGDLDTHGGLARDRRFNAHAVRGHVERDIVHQVHNARYLDARRGLQFVPCDGRAMRDVRELGLHAEALQRGEQLARSRLDLRVQVGILRGLAGVEQVDRRVDVFLPDHLRRFMRILSRHDQRRTVQTVSAQLDDGILLLSALHGRTGRAQLLRADAAHGRPVRRRLIRRAVRVAAASSRPVATAPALSRNGGRHAAALLLVKADRRVGRSREGTEALIRLMHGLRAPERRLIRRFFFIVPRQVILLRLVCHSVLHIRRFIVRFVITRFFVYRSAIFWLLISRLFICRLFSRRLAVHRLRIRFVYRLLSDGRLAIDTVEELVFRFLLRKGLPPAPAARLARLHDTAALKLVAALNEQRRFTALRHLADLRTVCCLAHLRLLKQRLGRRILARNLSDRFAAFHHGQLSAALALGRLFLFRLFSLLLRSFGLRRLARRLFLSGSFLLFLFFLFSPALFAFSRQSALLFERLFLRSDTGYLALLAAFL